MTTQRKSRRSREIVARTGPSVVPACSSKVPSVHPTSLNAPRTGCSTPIAWRNSVATSPGEAPSTPDPLNGNTIQSSGDVGAVDAGVEVVGAVVVVGGVVGGCGSVVVLGGTVSWQPSPLLITTTSVMVVTGSVVMGTLPCAAVVDA